MIEMGPKTFDQVVKNLSHKKDHKHTCIVLLSTNKPSNTISQTPEFFDIPNKKQLKMFNLIWKAIFWTAVCRLWCWT